MKEQGLLLRFYLPNKVWENVYVDTTGIARRWGLPCLSLSLGGLATNSFWMIRCFIAAWEKKDESV